MANILILGGDGYLGWPTAMYLSNKGHEVTVVITISGGMPVLKLNIHPLYENLNLIERARLWHELTGKEIKVVIDDLSKSEVMNNLFNSKIEYSWAINNNNKEIPESVIHYAEQPSAPYSLMSPRINLSLLC